MRCGHHDLFEGSRGMDPAKPFPADQEYGLSCWQCMSTLWATLRKWLKQKCAANTPWHFGQRQEQRSGFLSRVISTEFSDTAPQACSFSHPSPASQLLLVKDARGNSIAPAYLVSAETYCQDKSSYFSCPLPFSSGRCASRVQQLQPATQPAGFG